METSTDMHHKDLKTIKPASPDTLFVRFLQRKSKLPTRAEIAKWETDGGAVPEDKDTFVLIAGRKCSNIFQRCVARVVKYWRVFRNNLHFSFSLYSK